MRSFISAAFVCLGLATGMRCFAEGVSGSVRTEAFFGGGGSSLFAESTDNEFKWFTDSTSLYSKRNFLVTGQVSENLVVRLGTHFYESSFYGHLFNRICLSLACFYGSTSVINKSEPESIVTLSLKTNTLSIGHSFSENSDTFWYAGVIQNLVEVRARNANEHVNLTQTIYSPFVGFSVAFVGLPFTDINFPEDKTVILQGQVSQIGNSQGHILLRSLSVEGKRSLNPSTSVSIGIRSRFHSLYYKGREGTSRFSETAANPFIAFTLLF